MLRHNNTGGDDIEISAHNGFISGVKRSEISQYAPILAVERNCEPQDYITEACADGQLFRPITIPENGPIFLVWPLKELPEYYLNMRNAIWVFHVSAIAHSKK
ncbi:conserved hypothetical protein [Roseibium sp. TrichSKD4]|nr:conserved hypothetical protein [Roseibium sp. TrichSKD4]